MRRFKFSILLLVLVFMANEAISQSLNELKTKGENRPGDRLHQWFVKGNRTECPQFAESAGSS